MDCVGKLHEWIVLLRCVKLLGAAKPKNGPSEPSESLNGGKNNVNASQNTEKPQRRKNHSEITPLSGDHIMEQPKQPVRSVLRDCDKSKCSSNLA